MIKNAWIFFSAVKSPLLAAAFDFDSSLYLHPCVPLCSSGLLHAYLCILIWLFMKWLKRSSTVQRGGELGFWRKGRAQGRQSAAGKSGQVGQSKGLILGRGTSDRSWRGNDGLGPHHPLCRIFRRSFPGKKGRTGEENREGTRKIKRDPFSDCGGVFYSIKYIDVHKEQR